MNYIEENTISGLKDKICELLKIVAELEKEFDGRKFTLDGHLLGSIGEVFAHYFYGIDLAKASTKLHDGEVGGRNVQIKITQTDHVDIKGIPDYLIVLFLKKDSQEVFEVYNGPGTIALENSKPNSRNVFNKSLSVLRKQDDIVENLDRIKTIKHVNKWEKGLKN